MGCTKLPPRVASQAGLKCTQQRVKQSKCDPVQGACRQHQTLASRCAQHAGARAHDSVFRVFCPAFDFGKKLFGGHHNHHHQRTNARFFGHQSEEALLVKLENLAQP